MSTKYTYSLKKSEIKYLKPQFIFGLLTALCIFLLFLDFQSYIKYKDYQAVQGYISDLEIYNQHNARIATSYTYTIHWEIDGEEFEEFEEFVYKGNTPPDMESGMVWVNEYNDVIAINPTTYLHNSLIELICAIVFFIISMILRSIHMSRYPEIYYKHMNTLERSTYSMSRCIIMWVIAGASGLFDLFILILTIVFAIKGEAPSLETCEVMVLLLIVTICSIISALKWNKRT